MPDVGPCLLVPEPYMESVERVKDRRPKWLVPVSSFKRNRRLGLIHHGL